nr:unnamed protein product [Spirometra erinaceieuropaei]
MLTHLFTTFVNLMKAYDTVNHEGLWRIRQKLGCPERFTHTVCQLHDVMMACVTDNGVISEAFAVTNGMKQGCILTPPIFRLMFSDMPVDAYGDERPATRMDYRTDRHLPNSRRMKAPVSLSTITIQDLLFADD